MPRGGFALGAKSCDGKKGLRSIRLRVFSIPVHGLCFDHCMVMTKSLMIVLIQVQQVVSIGELSV